MQVNFQIQFPSGSSYHLTVNVNTTIWQIKEALSSKITSKRPTLIRLFRREEELENTVTMRSANIKDGELLLCKYAENENEVSKNDLSLKNQEKSKSTETVHRKYKNDPENFMDLLTFISNMGFPWKMVKCALRSQDYDTNAAIRLLLGKTEEDELMEMQEELNSNRKRNTKGDDFSENKENELLPFNLDQDNDRAEEEGSDESYSDDNGENYGVSQPKKRGEGKAKRIITPGREASHWTAEEDEMLLEKWKEFGSNWIKIQSFFPDRTKAAVSLHWNAHLRDIMLKQNKITQEDIAIKGSARFIKKSSTGSRRRRVQSEESEEETSPVSHIPERSLFKWTSEEEDLLFELWKTHGDDWSTISDSFPERRKSTIINHWNNSLRPRLIEEGKLAGELIEKKTEEQIEEEEARQKVIVKGDYINLRKPWLPEQDELLFEKWREKPDDWEYIVSFFQPRTINAVEQRWKLIMVKYLEEGKIVEVPNPSNKARKKKMYLPVEKVEKSQEDK